MDKLPPEILHTIFIKLDLQQRLKCLLVCRSWFSVLDRYCLFFDIKMDADKEQFSRARRMFKGFPERAAQVEQVHVYIKDDTLFNRKELFKFFPNAREMKASPDWGSGHAERSRFTRNINLTHSKSRLQVLHDCGHCELVYQMLYSNLGAQLHTLFLDCTGEFGGKVIFSKFENLPVLKKFTLKGSRLKLGDIEKMHNNIPSMEDLTFYHVVIEKGKMPSSINPAIRVTAFELYNGRFPEAETHT
jgi:hypothetical protein